MVDHARHAAGGAPETGPGQADSSVGPAEHVQLALDATITGPGMRTEDLYEPGSELKIKGERGTFIYKYATVSSAGRVSLHLVRDQMFRAVRPDQVTLVKKRHRWK